MASARLMRLLSRLAARDLAAAERRVAEAAANLRSMARNVSLLNGYTKGLSTDLAAGGQAGNDFSITIGFRASGIRASGDAASAMHRGQSLQQAALDRLANELHRRDAIASAIKAIEAEAGRKRTRLEDHR
jgi:hypothetical protein